MEKFCVNIPAPETKAQTNKHDNYSLHKMSNGTKIMLLV